MKKIVLIIILFFLSPVFANNIADEVENLINENTKNIVQADLEKNILELDKQLQIRMELKELEKQLANELGIIISS